MNKDILKSAKKYLYIMIAWSVLCVAGIPGIVIGAINGWWGLTVPSIILVVSALYGLPFGWIGYGNINSIKSVTFAVMHDGITDIGDIAGILGKKESEARKTVITAISKRYLTGYVFDKTMNALVKIENEPREKENKPSNRCQSCGAPLLPEANGVCAYCNTVNM
jgi:hypothetical protein